MNFKQYDAELMMTKLEGGIGELDTALENMGNLSGFTDADVLDSYNSLSSAMHSFSDYCAEILDRGKAGDFDSAGELVTELRNYIEPAQTSLDAYDALVTEKQKDIQQENITLIGGTCNFSIIFAVVFLLSMVFTITVVILTIAGPAKKRARCWDRS